MESLLKRIMHLEGEVMNLKLLNAELINDNLALIDENEELRKRYLAMHNEMMKEGLNYAG